MTSQPQLEDDPEWQDFAAHVRESTVPGMLDSAFVMSLVPDSADVDVQFAVQLGLAIMLEKPILAVVRPGARVPPGIRKVAAAVIHADTGTEEGQQAAARAVKSFLASLEKDD